MSLLFSDDFNGPAGSLPDATKWAFRTGPHGSELQSYTDANAVLDGQGNLAITARKEQTPDGYAYSSSWLQTKGLFEFQYGWAQARLKVPPGAGLWPAFWAMGNDHDEPGHYWPVCGEIDFMEAISPTPNRVYGSLHGPKADGSEWSITHTLDAYYPLEHDWHIYGARWSQGRFQFTVDNWVYADVQQSAVDASFGWVFDHPFYLILNLAVGGWAQTPDDSAFPATLLVDWVRVFS